MLLVNVDKIPLKMAEYPEHMRCDIRLQNKYTDDKSTQNEWIIHTWAIVMDNINNIKTLNVL